MTMNRVKEHCGTGNGLKKGMDAYEKKGVLDDAGKNEEMVQGRFVALYGTVMADGLQSVRKGQHG